MPTTISELIDDLIKFCETYIDGTKQIFDITHAQAISEFALSLANLKKMRVMLDQILKGKADQQTKDSFALSAKRFVGTTISENTKSHQGMPGYLIEQEENYKKIMAGLQSCYEDIIKVTGCSPWPPDHKELPYHAAGN